MKETCVLVLLAGALACSSSPATSSGSGGRSGAGAAHGSATSSTSTSSASGPTSTSNASTSSGTSAATASAASTAAVASSSGTPAGWYCDVLGQICSCYDTSQSGFTMPSCGGGYPCCITYDNSGLDNACDCYTQMFLDLNSETCQMAQQGIAAQHPGAMIVPQCPP